MNKERSYGEREKIRHGAWAERQERELCEHGFRRAPGFWYDCHTCAMLQDRSIEADREFHTHGD
jgi:hypothetical protein